MDPALWMRVVLNVHDIYTRNVVQGGAGSTSSYKPLLSVKIQVENESRTVTRGHGAEEGRGTGRAVRRSKQSCAFHHLPYQFLLLSACGAASAANFMPSA